MACHILAVDDRGAMAAKRAVQHGLADGGTTEKEVLDVWAKVWAGGDAGGVAVSGSGV